MRPLKHQCSNFSDIVTGSTAVPEGGIEEDGGIWDTTWGVERDLEAIGQRLSLGQEVVHQSLV